MKLELHHLSPYLPYGLKVQWDEHRHKTQKEIIGAGNNHVTFDVSESDEFEEDCLTHTILYFHSIKPILRPLTDLTKEEHCKFADPNYNLDIGILISEPSSININETQWVVMKKLFEWHFDVFGLIDKGLAIDINTL